MLSPILFNLYSEVIVKEAPTTTNKNGVKFNGQIVSNICYADDTVILADSEDKLQESMNKIYEISKKHGMKVNLKKTKTTSTTK